MAQRRKTAPSKQNVHDDMAYSDERGVNVATVEILIMHTSGSHFSAFIMPYPQICTAVELYNNTDSVSDTA